jgi:copper chaperone
MARLPITFTNTITSTFSKELTTMETLSLTVPDISCDHCVATIKRAVSELAGVVEVIGDAATKHIEVRYGPPATRDQIIAVMTEWGYPPTT